MPSQTAPIGEEFKTEPLSLSEVQHLEVLDSVWGELTPMAEKGLSHGIGDTATLEGLYEGLKAGIHKLWVIHRGDEIVAGVVISIKQFPRKKTIYIELLAGRDLDSFLHEIQEKLRELKVHIQADTIEASCRPGLTRVLADWKVKAYLMELP